VAFQFLIFNFFDRYDVAFAVTGVVESRRGAFARKVLSQSFSFVSPSCLSSLTTETSSSFCLLGQISSLFLFR